jgi:hypothetical protein
MSRSEKIDLIMFFINIAAFIKFTPTIFMIVFMLLAIFWGVFFVLDK